MPRKKRRSRGGSGGLSRRAALGLIVGGSALGISASGAYDQVITDRGFDVPVRGDDEGLLGITLFDQTVQGAQQGSVELIELQNRFSDQELDTIEIEVVDTDGLSDLEVQNVPDSLDPAEEGSVTFQVDCGDPQSGSTHEPTIKIAADGEEEGITAERTVQVTCEAAAPDDPCEEVGLPGSSFDRLDRNATLNGEQVLSNAEIVTDDEVDFRMQRDALIDGVLNIDTDDEVDVDLESRSEINDQLRVNTGDEVDIRMNNGPTIGGPARIETEDEVDIDLGNDSDVSGALQVDSDDEVSIIINGSTIGGGCFRTEDEVDVDLQADSTIEGDVDIDTDDEVDVDLQADSTIEGNVVIDTEDEVDMTLNDSVIEGNVVIDTEDEVTVDLRGGSVIEGDVEITTEDEVDVDLRGGSVVEGDVTVASEDDIEIITRGNSEILGEISPEEAYDHRGGGGP